MQDPNPAVNTLIGMIKNCIEATTFKNRSKSKPLRKNWITRAILKSCETKEHLYKAWRKNPTCQNMKQDYRIYTKILRKVIKDAKFKFEMK